jgi:hypothetical protein
MCSGDDLVRACVFAGPSLWAHHQANLLSVPASVSSGSEQKAVIDATVDKFGIVALVEAGRSDVVSSCTSAALTGFLNPWPVCAMTERNLGKDQWKHGTVSVLPHVADCVCLCFHRFPFEAVFSEAWQWRGR